MNTEVTGMRVRTVLLIVLIWQCIVSAALAQFKEGEAGGVRLGPSKVTRWRAGMIITASGGTCRELNGYVPVPTEWPEQQVQTISEEHVSTGEVRIGYENIGGNGGS